MDSLVHIFLNMNIVIYLLCGFALLLGGTAAVLSVLSDNGSQQRRSLGDDTRIAVRAEMSRLGKR